MSCLPGLIQFGKPLSCLVWAFGNIARQQHAECRESFHSLPLSLASLWCGYPRHFCLLGLAGKKRVHTILTMCPTTDSLFGCFGLLGDGGEGRVLVWLFLSFFVCFLLLFLCLFCFVLFFICAVWGWGGGCLLGFVRWIFFVVVVVVIAFLFVLFCCAVFCFASLCFGVSFSPFCFAFGGCWERSFGLVCICFILSCFCFIFYWFWWWWWWWWCWWLFVCLFVCFWRG